MYNLSTSVYTLVHGCVSTTGMFVGIINAIKMHSTNVGNIDDGKTAAQLPHPSNQMWRSFSVRDLSSVCCAFTLNSYEIVHLISGASIALTL